MTTSVPKDGSIWVWNLHDDRARFLIEVIKCEWNGEEWWVTTRTLPQAPTPMFSELTAPTEDLNELPHFWEKVTPVGNTLNHLSEIRSPTKPENTSTC